jgi:hypothetical protein
MRLLLALGFALVLLAASVSANSTTVNNPDGGKTVTTVGQNGTRVITYDKTGNVISNVLSSPSADRKKRCAPKKGCPILR